MNQQALLPFVEVVEIRPTDGAVHCVDKANNQHYWFYGADRPAKAKETDRGFLTLRFDRGVESWVFKG